MQTTHNYKPSNFATRPGIVGINGDPDAEIVIFDTGQAPSVGTSCRWLAYPGAPSYKIGKVAQCETHTNGNVTVVIDWGESK